MSNLQEVIEERYQDFEILFGCERFEHTISVVKVVDDFVVFWDEFEERFDCLSVAMARCAQVVYVFEQKARGVSIGFMRHGDDFVSAWTKLQNRTTIKMNYDGTRRAHFLRVLARLKGSFLILFGN
jgi:hypothetical protein